MRLTPLPRAFYARPSLEVAPELLGMHLVYEHDGIRRVGRIVETEAYQGPEDLAAHSARGRRTARTEVMFGPPGHAYVYLIYGIWNCLNVVTAAAGIPHAVLLRAVEPVAGLGHPGWGPGLLCRAFGIDRSLNGADLCGAAAGACGPDASRRPAAARLLIVAPPSPRPLRVGSTARIGVESAGEWAHRPWRFFDRDSVHVSTVSSAARRAGGAQPGPRSGADRGARHARALRLRAGRSPTRR